MALTFGIHIFAGGPEYHTGFQDVLPTGHLAAMAAVLWHAVSVNLLIFAPALLWLARFPNRALAITLCAIQVGWAALFLFYGFTMLGGPWLMPQWVIFLVVPLLTLYGSRQRAAT